MGVVSFLFCVARIITAVLLVILSPVVSTSLTPRCHVPDSFAGFRRWPGGRMDRLRYSAHTGFDIPHVLVHARC